MTCRGWAGFVGFGVVYDPEWINLDPEVPSMMGAASSGMEMTFQTFEHLVCLDDLLHLLRNDIEQLESQPPFYRLARFMKI